GLCHPRTGSPTKHSSAKANWLIPDGSRACRPRKDGQRSSSGSNQRASVEEPLITNSGIGSSHDSAIGANRYLSSTAPSTAGWCPCRKKIYLFVCQTSIVINRREPVSHPSPPSRNG